MARSKAIVHRTEIRIMGKLFRILQVKQVDKEDSYGECDGPARTIKIKAGIPPEAYDDTLMHEIIHAVLYLSGHSEGMAHDLEESLVLALETGLSEIYQLKPY